MATQEIGQVTTLEQQASRPKSRMRSPSDRGNDVMTHQQLTEWMRRQGLIADPPPEFLAFGEAWGTLSDTEKNQILWELDHLPPGPMASDIVAEQRR